MRGQRQLVDARPPLQPGQPLLGRVDRLGERRDTLGIDGVLVDPTLCLALRLDGRLAFLLRLAERLLRPHPGRGRVLRHAAEPGERVARLVHLGRGPIALSGQVAAHVARPARTPRSSARSSSMAALWAASRSSSASPA